MRKIHFIAIGGAAMHNLALAVSEKEGYRITGSDDEIFEPSKSRLQAKGLLPDQIGWFPERITPDLEAVIVGMHATEENPELQRAKALGIKIYSFPEYLYEQTRHKTRIVIGGSHGKTTTTAMILYVLHQMGIEADYMVGAQIANFTNMVRLSQSAKIAVFEGDEYLTSPLDKRPKFHLYKPHIAVLTGIAWDHINVFPTFENYIRQFKHFTELIEPNGSLIYFDGDKELCKIAAALRSDIGSIPYHTPQATVTNGTTTVTINNERMPLQLFGNHNLQNMNAARLVCNQLGISNSDFLKAIATFTGASNRLEKIAVSKGSVAFKDFAHSPSKLKATIDAVKEQYPDKRLIACMELHTFSSLRADFLPQYSGSMAKADVAFVFFNPAVLEHKRLPHLSPQQIAKGFGTDNVQVFSVSEELQQALKAQDLDNCALLMMTSGNFNGIDIPGFAATLLQK